MNQKIARFLSDNSPETPCLVVDLDLIGEAYDVLCRYLSIASVYYAVKANPAPEIVALLAGKGSNFDVASPAEIALAPRQWRLARAFVVRQHDQEGEGHRLRL